MPKRVGLVFSGGGSGGHVLPALTLIDEVKQSLPEVKIFYIGGSGIEKKLVLDRGHLFFEVKTGKLRRYISFRNVTDIFNLILGCIQSLLALRKISKKCDQVILFSTGGFVTVPVVFAAKLLSLKILVHEQTTRAGLANRINAKLAQKVYISFEDSRQFFPEEKVIFSGYPVRKECFKPELEEIELNGRVFKGDRPILLLTGGGNGSSLLNSWLSSELDNLLKRFTVIHQVGSLEINKFKGRENYLPVEFIGKEMISIMKKAKIIISRAGAGTVAELLAMKKRSILVPLKIAQKNEQYYNAMNAVKELNSVLIEEDLVKERSLLEVIQQFENEKSNLVANTAPAHNANKFLVSELTSMIEA